MFENQWRMRRTYSAERPNVFTIVATALQHQAGDLVRLEVLNDLLQAERTCREGSRPLASVADNDSR